MEERAWFEQVYRQNVDLLFRVGRRLLDSDENPDTLYDMVQEIFLLLWDRRETLKTHPNIGGWLMAALCVGIVGALLLVTIALGLLLFALAWRRVRKEEV